MGHQSNEKAICRLVLSSLKSEVSFASQTLAINYAVMYLHSGRHLRVIFLGALSTCCVLLTSHSGTCSIDALLHSGLAFNGDRDKVLIILMSSCSTM